MSFHPAFTYPAPTQFTLALASDMWIFYYCIALLVKSVLSLLTTKLFRLTITDLHPDSNLPLQEFLLFSSTESWDSTSSRQPAYFHRSDIYFMFSYMISFFNYIKSLRLTLNPTSSSLRPSQQPFSLFSLISHAAHCLDHATLHITSYQHFTLHTMEPSFSRADLTDPRN